MTDFKIIHIIDYTSEKQTGPSKSEQISKSFPASSGWKNMTSEAAGVSQNMTRKASASDKKQINDGPMTNRCLEIRQR